MPHAAADSRTPHRGRAGTPDHVAAQIASLRDDAGAFGTLLYTGHDWADPALARRSMKLVATEVMPRIKRKLL